MGPIKFCIQEFILGGLIIYHYFTLGPNFCPLKNIGIFFGNQWKMGKYTGCQQLFIVQHPTHFWPFERDPAAKLMPPSQISFKNW